MKRVTIAFLSLVTAVSLSAQRTNTARPATPPQATPAAGEALAGLTAAQRSAFADGLADFKSVEDVADGLGPVFNERSSAPCPTAPALGGGSARADRGSSRRVNGVYDPRTSLGGSLMQYHAIGTGD